MFRTLSRFVAIRAIRRQRSSCTASRRVHDLTIRSCTRSLTMTISTSQSRCSKVGSAQANLTASVYLSGQNCSPRRRRIRNLRLTATLSAHPLISYFILGWPRCSKVRPTAFCAKSREKEIAVVIPAWLVIFTRNQGATSGARQLSAQAA